MKNETKQAGDSITEGFKWRCIGPPRGGRVVAVAGDPTPQRRRPAAWTWRTCVGAGQRLLGPDLHLHFFSLLVF